MDSSSLTAQLIIEIKGLSSNFVSNDYTTAITNAQNETGWALPITGNSFRELWFKERAKRWLLFALYTENAESFKVNQLSLNQQFDHLGKLIDGMDKSFEAAKETSPQEFSGIDSYKYFGHVAGPGFQYDDFGNDISYEESEDEGVSE